MFKELIVTIVNSGFSDLVMNAAKMAGAQKGSLISGKAFTDANLSDVINVPVQEDREIVFIVCDTTIRDQVIRAINDAVGLDSTGRGMIFSLPIEKYLDTAKGV